MKALITGATGMVGRGVLLECLADPQIKEVLVVNRSPLRMERPNLREILVQDFFNPVELDGQLSGYDACFFCLGTTSVGKTEEDYSRITYNLTMEVAKTYHRQNPNGVFCYVSGAGTDSSEKGRSMWARVKGKTENALFNMGFRDAYMFRPGYIQPLKGIKSKTWWYQALYNLFWPLYHILKHIPNAATNTSNVGKAMIRVASRGDELKILENRDINKLANP